MHTLFAIIRTMIGMDSDLIVITSNIEHSVLEGNSVAWLKGEMETDKYFRISREQARIAFELGQLQKKLKLSVLGMCHG